MDELKLTVTKVKTFRGMEGTGYNAVLCLDGTPVAYVIEEGSGGEPNFDWHIPGTTKSTREVEDKIYKWIMEQSIVSLGLAKTEDEESYGIKTASLYDKPHSRLEGYVGYLVDMHEDAKRLKRKAKTHVILRKGEELSTIKIRPGETREQLEALVARKWPEHEIVREL
jgi:hypothetical protein